MRNKILIVDDSKLNRMILKAEFETDYEVIEAEDGEEAISYIQKHSDAVAAVLLDIIMPKMNGIEFLRIMNEKKYMNYFPIIVMTSEHPMGVVEECFNYGISDFIRKPIDSPMVRQRVTRLIHLFIQKNEFQARVEQQTKTVRTQYNLLQKQAEELKKSNDSVIDALGTIVEYRNLESSCHIKRIKAFTKILAEKMSREYPEYNLTPEKISVIVATSPLHDLGKIFISDAILLKNGKLSDAEFDYMKSHTFRGADALTSLHGFGREDYVACARDICLYHHERWDGSGYPEGLKEDEIPIAAQIVSVADVYDALISEKSYKKAYSLDLSFQMIIRGDCGMFSPRLMQVFRDTRRELEEVAKTIQDDKKE